MTVMNRAYQQTLAAGRLTIGLTTPAGRARNVLADVSLEQRIAKRADELGFSALWARDVPLVIAQGSDDEASVLDDPFIWLTSMAHVTGRIALGTAATVLPLHHPLLLAKSALSLNRLSGGRFIFGLGSGDRPSEFFAFGMDVSARGDIFRAKWPLLRAALSPDTDDRAGPEPLELGLRVGRRGLIDYLLRVEALGVSHVLLHLARSKRAALDIVDEIGAEILPLFQESRAASVAGLLDIDAVEAAHRMGGGLRGGIQGRDEGIPA